VFRVRSIPFPSRPAEGVHSLRRTRQPVHSVSVGHRLPASSLEFMAFGHEWPSPSQWTRPQPVQLSARHTELSIRCYPVAMAVRRLQHALLVVVATLSLGSCGSADPCGNKITSWVPSPDGSKVLVVFLRGCGATTRPTTQASLLSKDEEFLLQPTTWASTKSGNALVVDDGEWNSPSSVEARWTSARELVLIHQSRAKVILQESSVLGVSIEHRGASQP